MEPLMSTVRTASSRGLGGSIPNRWGVSPFSTQRQNFLSAVNNRCWYSGSAGMVISTHLPPPVMIDSTAVRAAGPVMGYVWTVLRIQAAFEDAGIQFTDDASGGIGVDC